METIICLVRHGQTEWNRKHLIQGTIDNQLNDTGRLQAKNTARIIKKYNFSFDALVSSPLSRAYETMKIIKDELKLNYDIEILSELIERDFGDLEGQKVSAKSYELMDKNLVRGLESLEDLQFRAISSLKKIAKIYPNKTVLVTTHSQVIKGALSYLINDFNFRFVIENSSLNFFKISDDKIIPLEYNVND